MTRTCIIAGLVALLGAPVLGQAPAPAPAPTPSWTVADILPMTCAQAWIRADKDEDKFLAMLDALARLSLTNRQLTFPNTREAGVDAGKALAGDCTKDPDDLLYAAVDRQVRRVGLPSPAAAK